MAACPVTEPTLPALFSVNRKQALLAVGAMDERGHPLDFSNWGDAYQQQGILAPGENILGAKPGGSTERLSDTSFATPISDCFRRRRLRLLVKLDRQLVHC